MSTKLFMTNKQIAGPMFRFNQSFTQPRLLDLVRVDPLAVPQTDNTIAALASDGTADQPWAATSAQDVQASTADGASWQLWWVTHPLMPIAISGTISANLRCNESSTMANYGVAITLWKLRPDGTTVRIAISNVSAELGTAEAAVTVTATPGGAQHFALGDRILFLPWWGAPSGLTTASGFTATARWNGTTDGATGDSYVTFTEDLVFAGPLRYPTRMPLGV